MTPPSRPAGAEKTAPSSSPLRWVWPPLLAVGLLIGYKAVQGGGLDLEPELVISIVVFLIVAVVVGFFARRFETRRERGSGE